MPSLRMKKSSVCCVKEKKCLLVSHKSSAISKKSHPKITHIASEDGAICQGFHEVSHSTESITQDRETAGTSNSSEGIHIKQLPRSLNDPEVIEEESPQVISSINSATIFSPAVRHGDDYDVPNTCDISGANSDQDFFCLGCAEESDGNSGSSSDYQSHNISDFYISDVALAGSPYDGSFMCDDIAEALRYPEHETEESSIFFDMTERHMSLPFLDDSVESSEMIDAQSSDETRTDYDNSSLWFAIHQIRPGDQEANLGRCAELDEAQYFDPHSFIRNFPDPSDVMPNDRLTISPKELWEVKPVTLVLDLDETLVHSTLEHCDDADFTFTVFFNMKEHTVYVKERPHLRTFLKKVEEMFQVVVFTASQSIYAEQLLDILDPDGKLISGRAYRESCIFSDGSYTKDLTVLGLDLAKVAIIDNSPQVFRLQVNNGIPIRSWFNDQSDNELISLIPFLETLANADDVRPLIAKRFGILMDWLLLEILIGTPS